ncbi:MAG: AtzE family amidohydrolase [Burkholderiaceae bacterium]|jgi:aspartyl-tRNA(Asn)/glutamyl-tRNA(Gln) amidotransferase subunit A
MTVTTAQQIGAAIRVGSISASAVVEDCLERIARRDPVLNSFTEVTAERARREAAEIDALAARGAALPPLAGVPYAVKNLFDVEGVITLAGAKINRDRAPAKADSVLVGRMRAAGAILVGALNMDEHAYGFTTENTHFGATRNPHDPSRTAGGSSGGCGAAVGAGLVPIALGSDTNGSIRVPSSLCGVFGLKPTYGRLPRTGTFPFVHGLDHLGPFGASVGDLALSYDAMQGFDAGDPACAPRGLEPTFAAVRRGAPPPDGERMAVLGGHFERWASPRARAATAEVAAALCVTHRVELQGANQARAAAFITTGSEGGALHRHALIERYAEFEPLSRDRLVAGSLIPASWYIAAQRIRARVLSEALALFEQYEVLIAPATPVCAPVLGTEWLEINGQRVPARASLGLLSQPISALGLPVCTVPIWPSLVQESDPADRPRPAQDPDGHLPLGVQIIAAPWREDLCLMVAARLEALGIARCMSPLS